MKLDRDALPGFIRPMRHLLLLALCAVAAGCTKRPPDPDAIRKGETPATEYYPLAVGNTWQYHVNALGQELDQTVKIVSEQDGLFKDSTGAQLSYDAWGVRDQRRYLLRDPVSVGERWTNVISVSTVEHYTIVEAGQSCEVPAGRFENCVKVESRNRVNKKATLVNELTFARGVGLVRVKTVAQTDDGQQIPQTTLELTKYELAKPSGKSS